MKSKTKPLRWQKIMAAGSDLNSVPAVLLPADDSLTKAVPFPNWREPKRRYQTSEKVSADSTAELRRRATERLKEKQKGRRPEEPGAATETQTLIQELQIHNIELEMQNEELRDLRAKLEAELEAGLELYTDLYDLAPVAYFTLDHYGTIRRVNLAGATLLETERTRLVNRRFGQFVSEADRSSFNHFLKTVFTKQGGAYGRASCEVALGNRQDRTSTIESVDSRHNKVLARRYGCIEGKVTSDGQECLAIMTDTSERKKAEHRQILMAEILSIINDSTPLIDTINCILIAIKRGMGFDAVGIRLQSGEDFPYYVQDGFADDFLLSENSLTVRNQDGGLCRDENNNISLKCACGLVISGKTDPTNPNFTQGGSFWTNDSLPLLDFTADQDPRLNPRNRCVLEGFCSVALIPIRTNQQIIGLLQLNERTKDYFTLDIIHYFEGLAASIGVAFTRKQAEEERDKNQKRLQNVIASSPSVIYSLTPNFKATWVSSNVESILGYTVDETMEPGWWTDHLHPDDRQQVLAEALNLFKEGQYVHEYRFQFKDGAYHWINDEMHLIQDAQGHPTEIVGSWYDLTKRKQTEQLLQKTMESLKKSMSTTIQVMVSAIEARDPYTAGHQFRVADLAFTLATDMGLSPDKIEGLRMAASIHDIGKLSVPAEILSKFTKLSDIEFSMIKEHASKGYEMLKDVESSWPLAEIVYQHHEQLDGSGYPRKLKGKEILIEARILAVADVVEAMASHRPYRASLGIDAALHEIEKNIGIFYDNDVVEACLRLFREKGFKFATV